MRERCARCRSAARARAGARPRIRHRTLTVRSSAGSWPLACGDRARGIGAVVLGPARQQPFRRVARASAWRAVAATLRHAAQHGVDQTGIRAPRGGRPAPAAPTNRPRHDRALRARGSARRRSAGWFRRAALRTGKPLSRNPPSRWRRVPSRRSTVAVSRRISARSRSASRGRPGWRFARQLLVERDSPPQHAVENVGSDFAGGEAGNFRLGGGARTRHGDHLCRELCPGREAPAKNAGLSQLAAADPQPDQRSTITSVPNGARLYRSSTSSLYMRMQPCETKCPTEPGSLVPWMA